MSTPANQQYGHNSTPPTSQPPTGGPTLPFTGADLSYLVIPGFALIVVGVVIVKWFGRFTDDPEVNKLS